MPDIPASTSVIIELEHLERQRFRDVANFLNLSDRVLVKQGCGEYFFTWDISEEVHETTVGKREGLGAF